MKRNKIDWKKASGLAPTIVQAKTGEVLMLAYSNRVSLDKSLFTKQGWYWSRSRQQLWRKGETSGNTQELVEVKTDCDSDTLLFTVKQRGVACHTGKKSCFYRRVEK